MPLTRCTALALASALALSLSACSKDPEVAKREFLQSGDGYVKQEKYAEAIIEYRNAVQQDPRFAEARQKLAEAYLKVGDAANAYREFIRAADLLPDDPVAQVKAGEFLLLARQFEDAMTRAEQALARKPDYVEAQILKANALAGLNKLDDALTEVEEAIRTDPDRSASYASLGAMRMVRGDRAQAEAAFLKAVTTDPTSIVARLALANFYWAASRQADAETHLKGALEIQPENPIANQALAYLFMATGRPSDAEPYVKRLATDDPGRLKLADYYLATKRVGEARTILEDVASRDTPTAATSKLRLAALGLYEGDRAVAMKHVDEILAKQPKNVEALLAKAQLVTQEFKLDEALTHLQNAVAANPESPQVQFALGRLHVLRREQEQASAAFGTALKLNPRLAPAQVELARLRLGEGKINEAEEFARAAITSVAGYADAHLLLARINILKGQSDQAEPSLKALEQAFPDSPAVQTEIGLLQLSRNNRTGARAAFERAIKARPTHLEAISGLVQLDLADRRADAARTRVDAAVAANPKGAGTLLLASRTYSALGDWPRAERLAQDAIEADPANLDAYGWLGRIYVAQKKLDNAIGQFTTIADRQPKSVPAHTILGMLFEMQQRPSEATARYERALEADPRAAVAANNLAWILATTGGNLDRALELARVARAQLPDRPEVNDTLGWIYVKKGLPQLAIQPLQDAVGKDPKTATYHFHLGMAYLAAVDSNRAKASLERALALDASFAEAAEAREALSRLK